MAADLQNGDIITLSTLIELRAGKLFGRE
jgi:hypothetical protein